MRTSRSGQVVALGDVAREVRDRCDDPVSEGIERCVRGEDFESGETRVLRWGRVPDDMGPTFTKRFRAGQLLYGTRRAYLRKGGMVGFDGVCANTTLVLEADAEAIDPALLSHVIQTEGFVAHAVNTSVGSTNPFTKWSSLRAFQFTLPSPARQEEIVRVLEAATDALEAVRALSLAATGLLRAVVLARYHEAEVDGSLRAVAELGEVAMGRQRSPKYEKGQCPRPYLSVINIGDLELDFGEVREMDFTDDEMAVYGLRPGDVLLSEGDLISPMNVGRPAVFRGEPEGSAYQNTLLRFRPGPEIDSDYAMLIFEGCRISGRFAQIAGRTAVTHLGLRRFAATDIPVVPREGQNRAITDLHDLRLLGALVRAHQGKLTALTARLREELVG